WLRRTKPQFAPHQNREPPETHRGACAVRHTNGDLRIFRRVLRLRLSPQELRGCGLRGKELPTLVRDNMGLAVPHQLPPSPLFRLRSTRGLPRCLLRRCAPNRAKRFLKPANAENFDVLTARSIRTSSVPLRKDAVH